MECQTVDPTMERCISKADLRSLTRSRREYMHRGAFSRIYPVPDETKYRELVEHMHNTIQNDSADYPVDFKSSGGASAHKVGSQ
jgi:hypothetical protein